MPRVIPFAQLGHLEGLTWLDHVEDNRDIVFEKEYLKIIQAE